MRSIARVCTAVGGLLAILTLTIAQPAMSLPVVAIVRSPAIQIEQVSIERLPLEVIQTIQTIEAGGAFRYRQDGSIFGNRERRLPLVRYGTYREYTVPTPSVRTRGARRLITAPHRIYYYTGDHYRSFQQIVR